MPDDLDLPDWVSERPPHGPGTVQADRRAGVDGAVPAARMAGRPRPLGTQRTTGTRYVVAGALLAAVTVLAHVAASPTSQVPSGPDLATRALSSTPSPAPSSSSAASSSSLPAPAASSASPSPTAPAVVDRGTGSLRYVPLPPIAATSPAGARVVRVSLQIEGGTDLDPEANAATVARVLGDRRGWQREDRVRFKPVSRAAMKKGAVDLQITIASPDTTDRLCRPFDTQGKVSCYNNRGRAVLNTRRWIKGVRNYAGDLEGYRTYLVNHEVGHGLGHAHAPCPKKGAEAPVMLQQTLRLDGCRANPYPTVS